MKLHVYISQLWNLLDTIGIALFTIGVVLRFIPATLSDAQLIYSVDVIFWNIRMLEIFSVNKYLGPYVKIMGKLLRDMCYFLTILFIAVTSFGVVRQTVHFQKKDVSWRLRLRNVWYYPYWMIYGELFAEEIDPCLEENSPDYSAHCNIYASWLAPAFMCIFLLVANILMVNLLIARFNATFIRNNANSKEIWMFQRYGLILQYEMRPILPPPFIIITHVYLAFKYIKRRCKGKRDFYDNGLKLFLSHEDTEKIHDFEEECMEDLYREKELRHQNSSEERIKFISERVENMSLRLDDMNVKENHLRLSLSALDHKMTRIDDLENRLDEAIRIIRLLSSKEGHHGSQDSLDDQGSHLQPPIHSSSSSIDGSSLHPRSYSLGSSDLVERNTPSPMLVHSKKKTLADQLKKFTSNVRRRQLSGSDFLLDETDQFLGENTESSNKELLAAARNNVRFLIGLGDVSNSYQENKQELVNLNYVNQDEITSHKQKIKNFASQAVRFVEPVVHAPYNQNERFQTLFKQPSIDVTSKLDSDTYTTSQLPEYNNSVSQSTNDSSSVPDELPLSAETPVLSVTSPTSSTSNALMSRRGRNSVTNQPLTLNTSLATSSFIPCSMPQSSACFTAPNHEALPPAAVRDLTSMFTPLIGEYTSITDNIDTSCLIDHSPPCSPASNTTIFDNYHELDPKLKERSAASNKQLELKQAEEMEHQRMESLIRHRLRQLSQSDGIELMRREWEHQRYCQGCCCRAGCRGCEAECSRRRIRGSLSSCRRRSGGTGRTFCGTTEKQFWLRAAKKGLCWFGRDIYHARENETSERYRRPSDHRDSLFIQRSRSNTDLSAEPRHWRHTVKLQVSLLNDSSTRRHSISLPLSPLLELPSQHNHIKILAEAQSLLTNENADMLSHLKRSSKYLPKPPVDIIITLPDN